MRRRELFHVLGGAGWAARRARRPACGAGGSFGSRCLGEHRRRGDRIAAADLHAFFSNIERDDKGGHASGSGRDRQQDQYCRMHAALPALPSFEIPRGPFEKREALAILVRLIAARNAIRPARRAPEWRQRDYDEDEAADDDKQIVGKADAGKAPHRHGEAHPRGR